MDGLRTLEKLSDEVKRRIADEYGGIEQLYKHVIDLNSEEHRLTGSGDSRLSEIEQELFDIEDKLEELGVSDGRDITSEIASDYGEAFVTKNITLLKKEMEGRNIDFEETKKWLKENHGIEINF